MRGYKGLGLVVQHSIVVLDEKQDAPSAPGVDEPGEVGVEGVGDPDEEDHDVDQEVDSCVDVQPFDCSLVVNSNVVADLIQT